MKRLTIPGAMILSTMAWTAWAHFPVPPTIGGQTIAGQTAERGVMTEELRKTTSLMQNWRFIKDDNLSEQAALTSQATSWERINLPHTWNAEAATVRKTPAYERGLGWYRLEFDTPMEGARKWLEIGAASLVADVWLNGQKLGHHKGGFTQFRFDVTDTLWPSGKNVLLVRVDNGKPTSDADPTAIPPLGGDFIIYGGLYRHVALIATADPVHFDLGDMGSSGVYARTSAISGDNAVVNVRAKLKSEASTQANYLVRLSLINAEGSLARSAEESVTLNAGGRLTVAHDLEVTRAHLWQGVADPYQYKLVAELLTQEGKAIDRVVQNFGIRQMRFDPQEGFFLNGRHVPLRGVAVHQEAYGKGWARSPRDTDERLALVKEIGANTIRLGHYPFDSYTLESISRMGLIAWAELPVGIGVTTGIDISVGATSQSVCPHKDASKQFRASARQQLQEMIRQQFNHAAVAMWSLGNETTFMHKDCDEAWYDNLTPVFRELQALAKSEDPTRPTTYADFLVDAQFLRNPSRDPSRIDLGGITDLWARNQYPLWYAGPPSQLAELLDAMRAGHTNQPVGISEYGAGAAITHHTDNVHGGPVEFVNPGVPVVFQPEEYASYVHEQVYAMIQSRDDLYATYVWNMFDFASDLRNEGDVWGVNTKGLVSFDLKTKKDTFYFYKANWSREPVVYITSRRYTNRAYAVADIKVYSNTDKVELSVNDRPVGSMAQEECLQKVCVFRNVRLDRGSNKLVAVGYPGGAPVRDSVDWTLSTGTINIAAGQLETGFTTSTDRDPTLPATTKPTAGELFGSDNFFVGGLASSIIPKNFNAPEDITPVRGTDHPLLFQNFRHGTFSYFIPLENGTYDVTLGLLEPNRSTSTGQRIFDVVANGETKLRNMDVLREAGGKYRTVVIRTFTAPVSGGDLKLDFLPARGDALVSNISIRKH
jgi:beta-galactosidase